MPELPRKREQVGCLRQVAEEEVLKILRNLPGGKLAGPDGIDMDMLKLSRHVTTPYLNRLFSACFKYSTYADAWKHACTYVLRKPGRSDYSEPTSYRPIALLSHLDKVLNG